MFRLLALLLLPLVLLGCAHTHAMESWCASQGGCLQGCRCVRLQNVASQFAWAGLDAQRLHVLDSTSVGAYSWPSGDVYVTAGLMDRVDDEELAAALTHEMGHLVDEYRMLSPVGLSGNGGGVGNDVEMQADAIAVQLLRHNHISPDALISVLQITARQEPGLKHAIEARIAALRVSSPKPGT